MRKRNSQYENLCVNLSCNSIFLYCLWYIYYYAMNTLLQNVLLLAIRC